MAIIHENTMSYVLSGDSKVNSWIILYNTEQSNPNIRFKSDLQHLEITSVTFDNFDSFLSAFNFPNLKYLHLKLEGIKGPASEENVDQFRSVLQKVRAWD